MRGNWSEVWDSFDRRKKKPANDGAVEAAADEADMFGQAGVAAE
jgi:ribonucleoside-diphosphate reductase beta chain